MDSVAGGDEARSPDPAAANADRGGGAGTSAGTGTDRAVGRATTLPTGTVTLLFTDIEGSTRLLQRLGRGYESVIADHNRLLREAFAAQGGIELDAAGDGLHVAFASARSAILATVDAQRRVAAHPWPEQITLGVRLGLHTGEPTRHESGYVGLDVHQAARICAAGHGGQILVSQTTRDLVAGDLPPDVGLVDLGEHRLRDLAAPQRLFQVVAPDLRREFPPLRTVDRRPNNLPRRLTSFVGRDHELAEAKQLLMSTPLLTLTGPGGVGKTRLALELGSELLPEFEDGVWLVELGAVADPALLGNAFATALAVPEPSGRTMIAAVAEHLESRTVLLIVDDCEHVLGAVAEAADDILRASPGVRLVVTSREPLGITGEAVFPVPPLSAPAPDRAVTGDAIAQFEACRLFAERCIAAQPSFRVTDENVQAIAQICRRLDGIPLALELAAARARTLPVEQIATRLNDRFQLLTGGSRNALPRHQTLRATIDWSYDLLSEPERTMLHRLSVFAGGCTLEAAEAVAGGGPIEAADVLDLVTRLVDRSLVVPEPSGTEARFTMLETVREYARERLIAAGEAEATRRRHRDWYLALVEQARPAFFRGPEPSGWLERLDREHDNLRAALGWSEGTDGEADAGLHLAAGLWRFWEIRGHLSEGRGWLERFLDRTASDRSARRADALTGAGILALMQGDHAAALAFHEESLEIHRDLEDEAGTSYALNNLANAAVQQGEYTRARELYEEALAIVRRRGDLHGAAFSFSHLADVTARSGDYPAARTLFDRSLDLFRQLEDRWGMAIALNGFAQVAARHGDTGTARTFNEQAIVLSRGLNDARGVARGLGGLAEVAIAEGDLPGARRLFLECCSIRRSLGDAPGLASALERLAWAIAGDEPQSAAWLVGASETVRESIRAPIAPAAQAEHERGLRDLAARLGDDGLLAARREGRELGAERVLARLLP